MVPKETIRGHHELKELRYSFQNFTQIHELDWEIHQIKRKFTKKSTKHGTKIVKNSFIKLKNRLPKPYDLVPQALYTRKLVKYNVPVEKIHLEIFKAILSIAELFAVKSGLSSISLTKH